MLQVSLSRRFKKDYKLCEKRGLKLELIDSLMMMIISEQELPTECVDHPLKGNWKGSRDCHIQPDWLLIYTLRSGEVIFERTGTHSDLFKK